MRSVLMNRSVRPYLLLVVITVVLWILDGGRGVFFTTSTAFSVLQQFATIGLIALGLGLSMIIREIDLSVAGMMSLSGCIAVLTGASQPGLGVALAVVFGMVWGLFQGAIMVWLRLGSIGVTLGGLLTLGGLAYVVTGNLSISYPRMDVALAVNHPVLEIFSLRSLVALIAFLAAAFFMACTRVGRDVYATGSDHRAAMVAGVRTSAIVPAVFACSGMLAALAGSLLSYSLAAASGVALTDVLVPAIAAAIIGGVSLMGGRGTPIGIVGGVLVLCLLSSGLNAIGTPPAVQDVVTGGVLFLVAIADAIDIDRRLFAVQRYWMEMFLRRDDRIGLTKPRPPSSVYHKEAVRRPNATPLIK
jgi:ribose/xylose/arabinose/galactoside ABC-type transport system permease subunit